MDAPERTLHEPVEDSLDRALDGARKGDEQGFVELWRALQPPLLRYLTVRGNDSAEDIAAETWLQVIRDLASFQGRSEEFRAWVFTVARHRAIDHGRARAARPSVPVAEVDDGSSVPSAEVLAIERVSTEGALELVATLPPDQAEMVMLRVVAGLDVAAVARIVGKKPGTVRVSVHRALRALSKHPGAQRIRAQAAREVV